GDREVRKLPEQQERRLGAPDARPAGRSLGRGVRHRPAGGCSVLRSEMLRGLIAALALIASGSVGLAQDWPTRPVTMIVPYAAGGPVDTVGRIMAQGLSELLGQQVIVENVTGAGGMTGANRTAKSAPD